MVPSGDTYAAREPAGTPTTRVPAFWAVYGKRPGDADDYRVLACSDGREERFRDLCLRPAAPLPVPGFGPVVTFGGAEPGWGVLSMVTWAEGRDLTGRPLLGTHTFLLEVTPAVMAMGFAALYRAAAAVTLPSPTPQVTFVIADGDVQKQAERRMQAVDELGWAGGVAAVLLEGRPCDAKVAREEW